ncbi:S41 family peptidase [uncultured Desulfovibrio sp.]|uniref:S41 family peptidase n=1 Tax=uncultured Desulfovibrio sp. TaxID=167968 RepID=UPI001C3A0208|nr:S41 family peptidase [uncultured Desulfovibrio sp.]HIX41528.1 S41 family peptidase [Candidatus Desulfovibrio intestinigallinarum]
MGVLKPLLSVAALALLGLAPLPALAAKEDAGNYDPYKRFSQVMDLVEREYVKDVKESDLINNAIKGMLQNLDPHSSFMSADEYKSMQETTSGEFFGIGVEIYMENGQVTVVSPIADTPADRAGLQAGDVILSIDGQSTQELTLQDVVSRIRGPKGSAVELTILHTSAKTPQTVRITRGAIPLISVKSKELEKGYYWIRITRFSERTTEELREAVKEARGDLKGIVLDLRNNPGGLLDQAVQVSDMFLNDGVIVSIKGRNKSSERSYRASAQKDDITVPVVALINAGSASASEIVAGALRDQKRALILGERSFGKGSVQNIIPLPDGSGLKLTVALYYTPNGSSIQAEGVQPDMEVPFASRSDQERFLLREQDLNRHLENSKKKGDEKKDAASEVRDQLERDNQLRTALQLLKGIPAVQRLQSEATH